MDRSLSNDLRDAVSDRVDEAAPPARKPGTVRPTSRGEITRWIRARFRASAWALHVPGQHLSGPSYDELLDYLAAGGRDFRAESSALNRFVLAEVQMRFEELGRIPTVKEFNEAMGLAVLGWIVRRFKGKVRDFPRRALTLAYARDKKRAGYGDRPVGVRTGNLALRIAEYGQVRVRKG